MIKCVNGNIEFDGTAPELSTDFSCIVTGLIETLEKNTPINIDDIILIVEKTFKLGVKVYFDFRAGENDED